MNYLRNTKVECIHCLNMEETFNTMTVDIFCPIGMTGLAKLVFHEFLHVDRIHAIGGHPVVSYAVVALVAVLGKTRQG